MKTSVSLGPATFGITSFEEFCTVEAISEIAVAAERHGFDAIHVTEHPAPHPDDHAVGAHHAPDSFVTLAVAAAVTSKLRLHTHLAVLPYRNPFILAKALSTLDYASGGRVIVGAGAGYLPAEFEALGVDYGERNALSDEAIRVLKLVWSGEPVHYEGQDFRATGNRSEPRPIQRPHPPIWVGGNSKVAIRRAVELGDGWAPFPNPPGDATVGRTASLHSFDVLQERIDYLRSYAREVGRTESLEIALSPQFDADFEPGKPDPARVIDNARRLSALGVTYLVSGIRGATRAEFLENLAEYAEKVLPATQDLEPSNP